MVKDYRRRSRDRGPHDRREDSRDRARRRRDDSPNPRRKDRRDDDARDKTSNKARDPSKTEVRRFFTVDRLGRSFHINGLQTSNTGMGQTDEEKKAERLAKLEAWKQKQAAERERKQKELEASGGTRSLLDEIDKKATISSTAASPRSPATVDGEASPTPYAGKFDPKAIVKKATSGSSTATKLGTDIALPEIAKASATLNSTNAGLKANKSPATVIAASGKCPGVESSD